MSIRWQSIRNKNGTADKYAIQSDCGEYTIARVFQAGECWYHGFHGKTSIEVSLDVDVVKQAANDHKAKLPLKQHESNDGV